jgi:hypothetical protein
MESAIFAALMISWWSKTCVDMHTVWTAGNCIWNKSSKHSIRTLFHPA